MASIVRLGRLMAALGLTLGSAGIMTPIWLIRAIFLRGRGRTKKTAEWPNVLQFWFTSTARMLLGWQARLGVQPAPYTRTPYSFENKIAGCSSFEWIQPAGRRQSGTGAGKAGFDDSSLPVRLSSAEWKKKTAGLWYRNKRDSSPLHKRDSPVVLYFHGGAYITLDAGDAFMGLVCARNQSWYGQVDILSVAYRLAPGSKYPSQLYEAYSAFCHLKKKGYKKIFIGGDSAGANLAATLWKYLDEVADEAADSVAGLLLFSPWLDMNGSKRAAFQQQISSCAVSPAYVETGFASLQTNGLPRATDPWISPVHWSANTMKRLPPLFVTHGGEETLVEEGMEFVGKARASGVDVHHFIKEGFPHDFQCLPWFPSAIKEVFTAQGEFIRERTVMA